MPPSSRKPHSWHSARTESLIDTRHPSPIPDTMNLPTLPPPRHQHLVLVLGLIALTGCSTLEYRAIQGRFENAVRADNERATMPFTDPTSQYQAVAAPLTPEYIARLDEALRPNAWTLRAVSQWRSGDFTAAAASTFEGQAEIARQAAHTPNLVHGRDSVLLTMLPGLIEDSRIRLRFQEHGPGDVAADYDRYAAGFRTAVRAWLEARNKISAPTPSEVIAYGNYQGWRILQNWSYILSQLPVDAALEPNREADAFVQSTFAEAALPAVTTLPAATQALANALPAEHPYRQMIELERQR